MAVYRKINIVAILLLCMALGVFSCKEKTPNLAVYLTKSVIPGEDGQTFLKIETEAYQNWDIAIVSENNWCSASRMSGTADASGQSSVVLSADNNGSESDRTAAITVTVGKTSQTVSLTQEVAILLDAAVKQTEIAATTTSLTIDIKTKDAWEATVTEGDDFCYVTPTAGKGNKTITLIVEKHEDSIPRRINVWIAGSGKEINIAITQLGLGEIPGGRPPEQNVPGAIELPEVVNKRWFVQHQYYAMEYDTAQRHSVWVAYVLNASFLQNKVSRTDAWAMDPKIPAEFQSLTYVGQTFPGYSRGHLLPSADRVFNQEANKETFYHSNMSPQLQNGFNSGIWSTLEARVREWAGNCDTLYIVTGGAINSGVETLGTIQSRNNVTIPKWYFKALVKRKNSVSGNDQFEGIAFWIEHKSHTGTKLSHSFSMTIRDLEAKTGINFFPNLNYVRPGLEDDVETRRDITKWAL